MSADGTNAAQVFQGGSDQVFAPDGAQMAFYRWTDGIFKTKPDGKDPTRVLADSRARYPAWSNDGRMIAFGSGNIDVVFPDGTGRRALTAGSDAAWKPDDSELVFNTCQGSTCGIYKISVHGGAAALVVGDDGSVASWSPDGKQIVYQTDANGVKHLHLINPDGSAKKQLTSGPQPDIGAVWAPDGFIYYISADGGIWAIWKIKFDGSAKTRLIDIAQFGAGPVDFFQRLAFSPKAQILLTPPPTPLATKTPVPANSSELPPIPTGTGGLVITNRYATELQIDIGNKFYRISPNGKQIVHLPPGRQTYSAAVVGSGRLSGSVEVQLAKYFEVIFEQ